jgi:hypothetical protein
MTFIQILPHLVKIAAVAVFAAAAALLFVKMAVEWRVRSKGAVRRTGRFFVYRQLPVHGFQPIAPLRLWGRVLLLFAVTRLVLFSASYAFAAATGKLKPTLFQTFAFLWNKYDSLHYLSIAQYGYSTEGIERYSLVFYPLYPALVRLFHFAVPDYFLAGAAVSNLFMLIGLYYLVRLAEHEWQDSETAITAAKMAVLYPLSFFFSIAYTESVFLTLCILSCLCLRRNKWLAAGLFGMLAALTRNQGVLLVIPIAIEAAASHDWRSLRGAGILRTLGAIHTKLAAILLPPVGTFLYLLVNKRVSGGWFTFLSYQKEHWQQQFGFFAQTMYDCVYRIIYWHSPPYSLGIWYPELVFFFVSFGLLIYMTNKTRLSYLVFSLAYLLVSFSPTGLLSGARYAGGLFTLYLFSARAVRGASSLTRSALEWILLFFLLLYTVLFNLDYVF